MAKVETIKIINSKGVNKRINIFLVKEDDAPSPFFIIQTKTLKDFKTRDILHTEMVYSVETFTVLSQLMSFILDDSEVKNKLILKELSDINTFKTRTNCKIN